MLYILNLKFLFCVQKVLSILNPEVHVSMDFYRLMKRVCRLVTFCYVIQAKRGRNTGRRLAKNKQQTLTTLERNYK